MTRRGAVTLAGVMLVTLGPRALLAHEGAPPAPHDLWSAWTFEPTVIALLLISAAAFTFGARRLRAHAGRWPARFATSAVAFGGGWLVLALSLVSPLHALGSALFSAHMAQHELLMVVAAPLLVAARPLVPALWILPDGGRVRVGRILQWRPVSSLWRVVSRPLVAWVLHAVAIWAWHIPALYGRAVQSEIAHTAQHASFLLTALLFWWTTLPTSHNSRNAPALFSLFGTALHTSILGALLTFSDRGWYPIYQTSTAAWHLSPVDDQQLGGLIMWIPGGITYLVVALLTAARLLREPTNGWSPTRTVGSAAA